MHQKVLCAFAEVLVEDVLLPLDVLDMSGEARSKENSVAQSSQDLRVDSGNLDETDVLLGKAHENIGDSQWNIILCPNEVGTIGTKDEERTSETHKGSMVADSFGSKQEYCEELAFVWKYAEEGRENNYKVDGYQFQRHKIFGESIGQLLIPKCTRTEELRVTHTSMFSSHMGPKMTFQDPGTIIEKRNPHFLLIKMPDNSTKHINQNTLMHYVSSSNLVNVIFEEEKQFGQVETPRTAIEEPKCYEALDNMKIDNLNIYRIH
ncbi:uncharacterized protein TNCV_2955251 [Trichonephila clavipes]|nr:uncharacterized protein TNCV_2955251 [Trichonephila clavipes]